MQSIFLLYRPTPLRILHYKWLSWLLLDLLTSDFKLKYPSRQVQCFFWNNLLLQLLTKEDNCFWIPYTDRYHSKCLSKHLLVRSTKFRNLLCKKCWTFRLTSVLLNEKESTNSEDQWDRSKGDQCAVLCARYQAPGSRVSCGIEGVAGLQCHLTCESQKGCHSEPLHGTF